MNVTKNKAQSRQNEYHFHTITSLSQSLNTPVAFPSKCQPSLTTIDDNYDNFQYVYLFTLYLEDNHLQPIEIMPYSSALKSSPASGRFRRFCPTAMSGWKHELMKTKIVTYM